MQNNESPWDGIPSKDDEREYIEYIAERFLENDGYDSSAHEAPAGYVRRSQRSMFVILARLASIQSRYDSDELSSTQAAFRAMLLVYPLLGDQRSSRKRLWESYGWPLLFASQKVQSFSNGFPTPLLSVRQRKRSEKIDGGKQDTSAKTNYQAEIIGRAVMLEYRRQRIEGSAKLLSAQKTIADKPMIDGIETVSEATVIARYKTYRRVAFERGYADFRALEAYIEGNAPPTDQIFLEDFPQNAEG